MKRSLASVVLAAMAFVALSPPANSFDPARVKEAIRKNWHGNDRKAIRVARCESGLDPNATSPSGTYLGLWQFSKATWNAYDGPGDDPRDVGPGKQTQVAWRLFQDQGWAPWPSCGSAKAGASDTATGSAPSGPEGTDARRR